MPNQAALQVYPKLRVRMGIHSGRVNEISDSPVASDTTIAHARGLFGQIRTQELRNAARICNPSILSECVMRGMSPGAPNLY